MQKLYSFDIFDTCLVRSCGKPVNLLYTLAYHVLGADADFVLVRDFVRKRQKAEVDLFKKGVESATIEQIYESFDFAYYTPLSLVQVMEMEKRLEEKMLLPVADVIKKIEECRSKGRVVFISDMYFSATFLRKILERHGIIKEGEKLYVSCDYQATKRTGKLFDIVQEEEGVPFNNWTHFGDDYNNDYIIPKRKGIKAVRIVHESLEYEKLCEEQSPYASNKISASIFSGILRATRLTLGVKDDGGFLTGVMCGLLLPFVASCLKDAKIRGIKRLYFASRDAYVMFLSGQKLSTLYPDIELRYIYLSTRTIYPTLIEKGTREEISELLSIILTYKPSSIIKLLGLEVDENSPLKKKIDINVECKYGDATSNLLIEWLCQEKQAEVLREKGKHKKDLLLDYLKQEGFVANDNKMVGLVDIGWRCSSQKFLSKIIGNSAMYYYWGVVNENFYSDEMGNYKPFFYTDVVGTPHPKLLECYICKNIENTVVGYSKMADGNVSVQLDKGQITQSMIDDFMQRKEIIEVASSLFAQFGFLMNAYEELFDTCSSRIMKHVLEKPSKQISCFLADKMEWDHYVTGQKLIRKIYPHHIIVYLFWRITNPQKNEKYSNLWRSACMVYTYGRMEPIIKMVVKALRTLNKI